MPMQRRPNDEAPTSTLKVSQSATPRTLATRDRGSFQYEHLSGRTVAGEAAVVAPLGGTGDRPRSAGGEAVESHAEPADPGNQETLGIRPTARMGEPPPSRILSGRVIRRNTVGTFSRFRRFSTM